VVELLVFVGVVAIVVVVMWTSLFFTTAAAGDSDNDEVMLLLMTTLPWAALGQRVMHAKVAATKRTAYWLLRSFIPSQCKLVVKKILFILNC